MDRFSFARTSVDERQKKHNKDKPYYVTFFNLPKLFLIHYSCKIIEPPYSNPIMILETDNDESGMKYEVLKGTGREHSDYLGIDTGGYPSVTEKGFSEVLSKTRTFVFNGDNLGNTEFQENALPALKSFFKKGGTVMIIGGDCGVINETFGCHWEHVLRQEYYPHEHFECIPTEAALHLLGTDADGRLLVPEEVYIGRANLVACGKGEALYIPRPYETKRQFLSRDGDKVEDDWFDDETQSILQEEFLKKRRGSQEGLDKILQQEEQWMNYKRMTSTPAAVYLDPNGGGSVVRIGDQLNEDTRMRSVLARLMTTDFHATKAEMVEKTRDRGRYSYPDN